MRPPICDTHSRAKRTEPVRLCKICQRMLAETEIATMTVDALLAAGYRLNVNNGGHEDELPLSTADRQVVLDAMFQTDCEHLKAFKMPNGVERRCTGWVFFVYGNGGYDVISDYTTNLEAVLAPVNAFTETLA